MIAAIGFGALIGILLGLLGGGGSILAVPALVYGAGLTLASAVPTSLLVVGVFSAAALLPRLRAGLVQWRASPGSSAAPAPQRRSPAPPSTGCSTPASSCSASLR
jgi:Sulfite exporter TauE/SafE